MARGDARGLRAVLGFLGDLEGALDKSELHGTVHNLFRDWLDDPDDDRPHPYQRQPDKKGTVARLVLCDMVEERGFSSGRLRKTPRVQYFCYAFSNLLPVMKRGIRYGNALRKKVNDLAKHICNERNAHRAYPKGYHGTDYGWWPKEREEARDVIGRVKRPSPGHHSYYRNRCVTVEHCRWLVWRALFGYDTPDDVRRFENNYRDDDPLVVRAGVSGKRAQEALQAQYGQLGYLPALRQEFGIVNT